MTTRPNQLAPCIPVKATIGDPICAAWAQVDAARAYNNIAQNGLYVGGATLAAAVLAAIFTGMAAKASGKAAQEARKQAVAAQQQLEATRSQLRAKLRVREQHFAPVDDVGAASARLQTEVINYGHSDASEISVSVALHVQNPQNPYETFNLFGTTQVEEIPRSLPPGNTPKLLTRHQFDYQPIEGIWHDSWLTLELVTIITWQDDFGTYTSTIHGKEPFKREATMLLVGNLDQSAQMVVAPSAP